jgi:cytochrome c oxidase assembly protein subunit 15
MGDYWVPYEIFDLIPWWQNFLENTAMVQLNHRILALTTYTSLSAMYFAAVSSSNWPIVPAMTKLAMNSVVTVAGLQVGLGIYTLLTHVPITMAAAHQAGSLAVITCLIGLIHTLSYSKYVPQHVAQTVAKSVSKTVSNTSATAVQGVKVVPKKFQPAASLSQIKKQQQNEE